MESLPFLPAFPQFAFGAFRKWIGAAYFTVVVNAKVYKDHFGNYVSAEAQYIRK